MRKQIRIKNQPRIPTRYLPIDNTSLHSLKHILVDIPLHILTVMSGVVSSGKNPLIHDVSAKQHESRIVFADQTPMTVIGRSMPAASLGFSNDIRKLMANKHHIDVGMFSFNSKEVCSYCHGKGIAVTELVFMGSVTTVCEMHEGKRYSEEALSYEYRGHNTAGIMELVVKDVLEFFDGEPEIFRKLHTLHGAGSSYLSLGRPFSTFSDGERQRIKSVKHPKNKGNIFILDESTTGLHVSDIRSIMKLLESSAEWGNTAIIVEHNLGVMK